MKITCADLKKVVRTNKTDSIIGINIVEDVEMAEVILKSVYNTFF